MLLSHPAGKKQGYVFLNILYLLYFISVKVNLNSSYRSLFNVLVIINYNNLIPT